jgi:membrane-associated phospholipid phosphatase
MLGALLLAVAVPSAMVGLGLHYFTDIVGGAALGTCAALLTALLLDIVCASARWRAAPPSPDVPRSRRPSR